MADEMRAYNPTIRERMASALQGGMEGMGVNRYKARKHAQTIAGGESSSLPIGMGVADFVPFVGTTMALEEGARGLGNAAEAAKRGDYIDATAETAGAAAGLIPGGYSTYKAGKNMLKKIKPIDLPQLKLIETDSVPKKRQSLKEWAMAGGGVPASHKGREHVWHKKAQKYAAGGEVFNTVPDMADSADIIQGPAYAKGGAVKKAVKDAVEGVVDGLKPMVDRINMHFKDVTKRVPELTEAAQKIGSGEMTRAQYEKLVNKHKPVTPYAFVPQPVTSDEAIAALVESKRGQYGKTAEIMPGEEVDARLDIPAYRDNGVWINSVHRKGSPTVYGPTSSMKNVRMIVPEDKALAVAQGGPKAPFAVIRGEWNPMEEADVLFRMRENLNNPDWAQVGMDPERHGHFYDRSTMQPIVGGEEKLQSGPLVMVRKPQYGNKKDFKYADGGDVHMGKGGAVKQAVKGAIEGMQKILAPAEREANKAKFLEPSAEKRRMYHGTQADINKFYPGRKGVFVTPEPEFAGDFATSASGQHGPNIMPVRVQVRNPFDYENKAHIDALKKHAIKKYGKGAEGTIDAMNKESPAGNWMYLEDRDVQKSIKDLGYDAYYVDENGVKNLGIYDPKRIKSDIGNRGTYDINSSDINEAKGGAVHMAKGGKAKETVKAGLKKLFGVADEAPKGVDPIIVRTPEERAVMEKFGQKQEQEAVRQKKVEKAAKESAGKSPEESVKPAKSTGKRVAVPPDVYRKMAESQGDEAVLRAARAGKHLKPTNEGYIGAPRTVTSPQGLGAMRRDMDTDFADSVEAVRLADPERLGTWYDRAKQGIAESVEPYQLPRTLEQHGVYSAGVSPESESAFSVKHLNSRVAGNPQMAYRGAGMRNLDTAVAEQRPAKMGFKIGEYAEKNDPRVPNTGLFGVNDFRRAQGMGYTDPQGNPWKAGVSDTMHPFMDAETALQVDRANAAGTGGRTDWQGPHIQEVPWVYGKGQDLYSRGKRGRYAGDELEGIKSSLVDANNTARDYFYKHAASATHEQIPGASLGHVRQALDMTPEQKLAYGRQGRWDIPVPEAALNEFPEVGAGNRDAIYSAMGYRQLPSREAEGLYINSLGGVETNPMTIARPLMDFPTGGGGGRMADESSKMMDTAEQFRALMDAQEAGAYNLPNTMASVKGKNSMVFDTRGMNPDRLADPSAGVLPTSEQLAKMSDVMGEHGFGVTATNRGAVAFPFDSSMDPKAASAALRKTGKAMQEIFPSSQEKAITSTGYVPGVGKRSAEGPLSTAPYSGEATSDMLQAFAELHPTVAQNLSESEAVRAAIRAKALRDSKLGGARGDIQETRRFFSEADWPKAVAMIRSGMTPAAALAALGYSASSMAGQEQ